MTIVQIFIKYNSEVLVDLKNMKSPETIAHRVKKITINASYRTNININVLYTTWNLRQHI